MLDSKQGCLSRSVAVVRGAGDQRRGGGRDHGGLLRGLLLAVLRVARAQQLAGVPQQLQGRHMAMPACCMHAPANPESWS